MEENFYQPPREYVSLGAKALLKHLFFFCLTFFTSTIAGLLFPFGLIDSLPQADPQSFSEFLSMLQSAPAAYLNLLYTAITGVFSKPEFAYHGFAFSGSLMFILLCHEAGHYFACRYYGVAATLPFFIPTPPMIGPAGTFGAFIKITSQLPSRRATFDIGVAGPLAGFLAIIPVTFLCFLTLEQWTGIPAGYTPTGIIFSDPPLMQVFAMVFGVDLNVPMKPNPFYGAAWVGILVTALNLIPAGQLDGGHGTFAVFGERWHGFIGKAAFVVMLILTVAGAYFYNSPSGILFTVILGIMLRIKHPQPWDNSPLDAKRKIIAAVTLIVFLLSFSPFPIKIL